VNSVLAGVETAELVLRPALFWLAAALAAVFGVDWLVRTRRINPFNPLARFFRSTVDPLIAPVERRVLQAGGTPASAPWWALVFVVVGGIVLLALLDYVHGMLAELTAATGGAPGGMIRLFIQWTFLLLRFALIVRIVSSWIRISPYSAWVRWSYGLTEWMLRPLRHIIPPLGTFDLSPLVAWFGLSLLEWFALSLLVRPF
jgi:YggT family protein